MAVLKGFEGPISVLDSTAFWIAQLHVSSQTGQPAWCCYLFVRASNETMNEWKDETLLKGTAADLIIHYIMVYVVICFIGYGRETRKKHRPE